MPVSDYTPTVDAVAAYLRARTKTLGGQEAGTFAPAASAEDEKTRPSFEQVTEAIGTSVGEIAGAFGSDIPDAPGSDIGAYRSAAQSLAALGAALIVELSYFPEQIPTGRSPYIQLKDLYDSRFENLKDTLFPDPDDGGSPPLEGEGFPSYGGFPCTAIGMEHPW